MDSEQPRDGLRRAAPQSTLSSDSESIYDPPCCCDPVIGARFTIGVVDYPKEEVGFFGQRQISQGFKIPVV